jgi:ATP-dependent Clp protease adaptor protein ClpS
MYAIMALCFIFVPMLDTRVQESSELDLLTETETGYQLIVWNDNVNTFEWVIKALVEVCGHNEEQAEQCSLFIHHHGKYAVKEGDYDTLKPMREAITERGIDATIEALSEA